MGFLGMFNRGKVGGLVHYLNLDGFWFSLTQTQREQMIRYGNSGVGQSGSIAEGTVSYSSARPLQFLTNMLTWAVADHDYDLSDRIIEYSSKIADGSTLVDQHFFLTSAADCYYKQRETRDIALSLAEQYYKKDIELFPRYKSPLKKEMGCVLPRIPSFSQLAILYEKSGRYQEAIDICRLAVKNNVRDNTKSGFEGRIEKLGKKLHT